MRVRSLVRACLVAAGATLASIAHAATYDLAADWSDAANPNGTWSYRAGNVVLPSVDLSPVGLSGQLGWAPSATGGNFLPLIYRATTTGSGLGFDYAAGTVVTHTWDVFNGGSNGEANILWTSPVAGTTDITGSLWAVRDIGRTLAWELLLNGTLISSGSGITGSTTSSAAPFLLSSGSGGAAALNDVAVAVSDTLELRFLTAAGTEIGDLLAVNFTIVTTPGASVIPVPASLGVLATAVLMLGVSRRRRKAMAPI